MKRIPVVQTTSPASPLALGAAPTTPTPARRRHDQHPVLEATTLAGAASGAVVGAIAGPPGVLVGAAIGTAVGLLAGRTLETAEDRAERHDHDLDDEIGVTRGPVGMGAVNVRPESVDAEDCLTLAGQLLCLQHERLERIYEALVAACVRGDWAEVRAEWELFEPALRDHMATEERTVFPGFREAHPAETAVLIAEHAELRTHLDELAIGVELHTISPNQMEQMVERLRAHGRREEELLYPWMDTEVGAAVLKGVAA